MAEDTEWIFKGTFSQSEGIQKTIQLAQIHRGQLRGYDRRVLVYNLRYTGKKTVLNNKDS